MMADRILVVEDETKIARFIELELMHEGYEVEKAFDGRDGLEKALRGDFSLVVLDVMLPQLNGLEVLRRIRKESDLPIILLTARRRLPYEALCHRRTACQNPCFAQAQKQWCGKEQQPSGD